VHAVLYLLCIEPYELDAKMREVLENVGDLIGRAVERKQNTEKIQRLAFRDSLTNLPNRQAFHDTLRTALLLAERHKSTLALLFLDLDGFKKINDSFGHKAGDRVLREVARRFSSVVRQSDFVARQETVDSVARLAGDEFTVILNDLERPDDAARVADRLIEVLSEPISLAGQQVFASTSVGIAIYPSDGSDPETLLTRSDTAMYFANGLGPNHYQFFAQSMNRTSARRLHVEGRLRGAMERGEFSLRYQPLRHAISGRLVGAEALLRWLDPEQGFVSPQEFIPVAEDMGLIVELGAWVLRKACEQHCSWCEQGYRPFRMNVNVSGRQISQLDMADTLAGILDETGASPNWLELEITESTIMQDDEITAATLTAIQRMGVGLALDDFGTGYSSLNCLRRFPIDRIKVDRSFVVDVLSDADAAALTRATIAMAHSLRVQVVGEGVDLREQADFLRSSGCDELQGFLLGRPVTAAEFERFLERDKPTDE
jgi:diguanylate cyclase (GGDEF)-like protein